jgi:hypothetical protein
MKKSKTKDQEQNRKLRRLSLSRETIRVLNDPTLLELARGGAIDTKKCCTGTSTTEGG